MTKANPKAHRTVALLMPIYNEIDGLRQLLPQIDLGLFDDVLVVDGGSRDGSWEHALSRGLRVMTQVRKGLVFGVLDGIRTLETDYVIEFSPDGNCLPERLPDLVRLLREGHDLVVVSRYLPPARSYDDTWITALGNWGFSKLFRFLGPNRVTDALNMYRGFRCAIVQHADFERLCVGPVFEPLVTGWVNLHRMSYAEIAGDEPARIGGASKMRVLYNGSCILLMVARLYLRRLGIAA